MTKKLMRPICRVAFVYPPYCTTMVYAMEPDLPDGEARVQDCGADDRPRLLTLSELDGSNPAAIGIIGGSDGPTAIFITVNKPGKLHCAVSALRFKAPEKIEWQMVFYHADIPDISFEVPLSQRPQE